MDLKELFLRAPWKKIRPAPRPFDPAKARYLHVSCQCGMRDVADDKTGLVTKQPWIEKPGRTYRISRNDDKRERRGLPRLRPRLV